MKARRPKKLTQFGHNDKARAAAQPLQPFHNFENLFAYKKLFVSFVVALSLTCWLFCLLLPQAEVPRSFDGNHTNLSLFTVYSNHYPLPKQFIDEERQQFPMWFNRFGGPIVSGYIWDITYHFASKQFNFIGTGYNVPMYCVIFSTYQVIWFLLLCVLFIIYRHDAIFLIIGTFAGLMANFQEGSGCWFMPWDYPALFFFTWAVFLYMKEAYVWMMIVIFVGSFFKETVCVTGILLLFGKTPLQRRLLKLCLLTLFCFALRELTTHYWGASVFRVQWDLSRNCRLMFTPYVNWCGFMNCGTLLLLWFLPLRSELKFISFFFLVWMFFVGSLNECREYYELLPIGLIGLSNFIEMQRAEVADQSAIHHLWRA
jgi:hypothetical protein